MRLDQRADKRKGDGQMDGCENSARVRVRCKGVPRRISGHERNRRRAIVAGTTALALFTVGVATTGGGGVQAAPIGQDLTVTASDLSFIPPHVETPAHDVVSA